MDLEKRIQELKDRLRYIQDIFGAQQNDNTALLESKLNDFLIKEPELSNKDRVRQLASVEDLFAFLEKKLEKELTPMDKVRIVRNSQRICLKDILENVYDNYTEIGGQDEYSIDPSMLIARAYITRRVGKKVYHQPVMVIGQEKGHGQEFRNGGSVKPWGNAKAQHYMKVAERENIPIHSYIFTPGSYPIEDYPGAAQQIASNLYTMAGLRVPVIAVISEGGSGGAEAIGLADTRLMLSHGYYSVISPEGAAAIEGHLRKTGRVDKQLIEKCARQLKITAQDNLQMGFVDSVLNEPPLGARPQDYSFFKQLRREVIKATDGIVLSVRGMKLFRLMALRRHKSSEVYVRWNLSGGARDRLAWRRYQKFRKLADNAYNDRRSWWKIAYDWSTDFFWVIFIFLRHDFFRKHQKRVSYMAEEVEAEVRAAFGRLAGLVRDYWHKVRNKIAPKSQTSDSQRVLTKLSPWNEDGRVGSGEWLYVSNQAKQDKAVSCPNREKYNCLDQWAPDLFADSAGVCSYCGYHFPMEYKWYLYNLFDPGSIHEFNKELEAANPLQYEGLDVKLEKAQKSTGQLSGCLSFEAKIGNVNVVVAMLIASFRGGSVGACEGEKFIRAAERARKKHMPFIAYTHGTAGIRIQEGTNGVIQMPRCTMAVRRYMEAGGLYLVVYDTNSYAGPVASFLGCSPYQFAVRSANIGFAGPGVIRETTGIDIPPDYHRAYNALSRGHIQDIWDRRELKNHLHRALVTMGGRNLYYR